MYAFNQKVENKVLPGVGIGNFWLASEKFKLSMSNYLNKLSHFNLFLHIFVSISVMEIDLRFCFPQTIFYFWLSSSHQNTMLAGVPVSPHGWVESQWCQIWHQLQERPQALGPRAQLPSLSDASAVST